MQSKYKPGDILVWYKNKSQGADKGVRTIGIVVDVRTRDFEIFSNRGIQVYNCITGLVKNWPYDDAGKYIMYLEEYDGP